MSASAITEPLAILLPPLFGVAVYTEVKHRRIPNWLTGAAVVCALVGAAIVGGWEGAKCSLLGLVVGGGVFLPFCLIGAMGGGDFKLMASVGAIVGYPKIWSTLYCTCLAGGALALLYMIWTGQLVSGFARMFGLLFGIRREQSKGLSKALTIPYGLAIAIGTAWAMAV